MGIQINRERSPEPPIKSIKSILLTTDTGGGDQQLCIAAQRSAIDTDPWIFISMKNLEYDRRNIQMFAPASEVRGWIKTLEQFLTQVSDGNGTGVVSNALHR